MDDILKSLDEVQRKAAETLDGPVLIYAGAGSGKCVTGDTLLYTNKGLLTIKEIVDNKLDIELSTVTLSGKPVKVRPSHWWDMGIHDTIVLSTAGGYMIEGTPEHPIVVITEKGELAFKKIADIKPGEYVAMPKESNLWSDADTISEEMGYLLGLLTGDGCLSLKGGTVTFSNGDDAIADEYKRLCQKLLGISRITSRRKEGTGTVDHYWHSIKAKQELEDLGLNMTKAAGKVIPEAVLKSSKPVIAAFIQGLFDLESSVGKHNMEFTTASEELAKQLQVVLRAFGIRASRRKKTAKGYAQLYWRLSISGLALRKYSETIGFRLNPVALEKLSKVCGNKTNTNVEVYPNLKDRLKDIRIKYYTKPRWDGRTSKLDGSCVKDYFSGKRKPSSAALTRLINPASVDDPDVLYLQNLADNICFEKVEELAPSRAHVYDLTVPVEHSFVSNSFISHNTRVMTHRVAYMISKGINPENIMCITFTNKAANEMKERIKKLVGEHASLLSVGTFHATCARLLRELGHYGLINPDFTIIDEEDSTKILKEIIKELGLETKPGTLKSEITAAKQNLRTPSEHRAFLDKTNSSWATLIYNVFIRYQAELVRINGLDFDDLIVTMVRMLESSDIAYERITSKYKYICVDEYQDTSFMESRLVNLLASRYRNLVVVGDPRQCVAAGSLISTTEGSVKVEDIRPGDKVLCATGRGTVGISEVSDVYKKQYTGKIVVIQTEGGLTIRSTPEHTHFAGYISSDTQQRYFTYLMFKEGIGYRIGTTTQISKQEDSSFRLKNRLNQERADKLWILEACDNKNDANYWEQYYSLKYGIPTWRFVANDVNYSQELIYKLHNNLPTYSKALALLNEKSMFETHPHHVPKCMNKNRRRNFIINMCANNGTHAYSISGSDIMDELSLNAHGLKTKKAKAGRGWRIDNANSDLGFIYALAEKVERIMPINLVEKAGFTSNSLPLIPASHVRKGMRMFVLGESGIVEDIVKSVTLFETTTMVYDLNIDRYHNFICDRVVTHNCIYGFKNADFTIIMDFNKVYKDAKVHVLNKNYRSGMKIVNAAECVVSRNKLRPNYVCNAEKTGGFVEKRFYGDEDEESTALVDKIAMLLNQGYKYSDIAVLYRIRALGPTIEHALLYHKIPYLIVGSTSFHGRQEIKDIAGYLRLLVNRDDDLAITRVANIPARGIGRVTVDNLKSSAIAHGTSMWRVLEGERPLDIGAAAWNKLQKFHGTLSDLISEYEKGATVAELIELILTPEFKSYLAGLSKPETRFDNVEHFLELADEYKGPAKDSLSDFLNGVVLDSSIEEEQGDMVRLMTVHQSKGLEFPVVFVVGLEEEVFPHKLSLNSQNEIEEERRICYVAMTRAISRLYLSGAYMRTLYGVSKWAAPSRFLGELEPAASKT